VNCIEKLDVYLRGECEPCIRNGKIIEFEELPEHLKYEVDYYDKDKDFILYCEPCKVYKLLEGD
jgi:hypothetical protein